MLFDVPSKVDASLYVSRRTELISSIKREHKDVKTTMIYTNVISKGGMGKLLQK